jgi:hypothetical protein
MPGQELLKAHAFVIAYQCQCRKLLVLSHAVPLLRIGCVPLQVQGAPQAKQQVPTPTPDPLAGLAPLPGNLPPGLSTLNLTQLAPLLPLLANINATVVASWVPVLEAVNGSALEAWAPVLNYLSAATVEAALAALPTINVTKVLELVPAINALNASTLEGYIRVLAEVRPLHTKLRAQL